MNDGYRLTLTYDEQKALGWIADRYECARILYDGMYALDDEHEDGTVIFAIPEGVAWAYQMALPEENGNPSQMVPPCAGGTLADKLVRLWEEIV